MLQYRNIWNDVESQLFEKLIAELINAEGKYIHGKMKTWKEGSIKMLHSICIAMEQ